MLMTTLVINRQTVLKSKALKTLSCILECKSTTLLSTVVEEDEAIKMPLTNMSYISAYNFTIILYHLSLHNIHMLYIFTATDGCEFYTLKLQVMKDITTHPSVGLSSTGDPHVQCSRGGMRYVGQLA
uniref:Uncharacterized protein n=1 Tax=Romanomermis culicivorax TaxID=13658 RepID=A0A915KQW0_ROMCU